MSYALSEIERLLANLIRIGVVTSVDAANARVKVKTGGLSTDWLPWLAARAGTTRKWSAPTVGEQVLVLSPYGDTAQAVVLPAIYQDNYTAPATNANVEKSVFPDGTTVEHNSTSNTLTVTVAGDAKVIVNCKQATINADTSITLNTPQTTCTGKLDVLGLLTYMGGLTGSGGTGASMTGALNVTGTITNNGKNVGSTHKHSGVQTGGGQTGDPI